MQHNNFNVVLLAVFGYGGKVLWWLHCCEPLRKTAETERKKTDYQRFFRDAVLSYYAHFFAKDCPLTQFVLHTVYEALSTLVSSDEEPPPLPRIINQFINFFIVYS
jgi:hypothetical protein